MSMPQRRCCWERYEFAATCLLSDSLFVSHDRHLCRVDTYLIHGTVAAIGYDCEVVSRCLLESGRDASELLEPGVAGFDQVALDAEMLVEPVLNAVDAVERPL